MNFLQQPLAGLPLWMWLAAGAVAVGIAFWMRRQASSSTGTLGQNSAAAQAPSDPNIDPNTGAPYSIESQINPFTGLPAYYGGPGVDTGTGGTTGQQSGTIRQKSNSGPTKNYDESHNGVPLDSQPGTSQEGVIPFGSNVALVGAPVKGPSNFGNTGWQAISFGGQYGYVSAYDLTNGGTQATPYWPVPTDLGQGNVSMPPSPANPPRMLK